MIFQNIVLAVVVAMLSLSAGISIGYLLVRYSVVRYSATDYRDFREEFLRRALDSRLAEELGSAFYRRFPFSIAQYMIGEGLITKEELVSLENGSLAQSNLAFGIMLPFSMFVCSIASRWYVGVVHFIIVGLFVSLVTAALFFTGMERRFRYVMDLHLLVLGRLGKIKRERNEGRSNE